MTKKKQETIKATNDWIKKIKATGQYKNVEDSDFVNASTLRVSAFNFNDLVGDVVIIKSRTHQYYIKIHNKHFINWFDSPSAPQIKRCYIKNGEIYKNGVEICLKRPKHFKLRKQNAYQQQLNHHNKIAKSNLEVTNDVWHTPSNDKFEKGQLDSGQKMAITIARRNPISIITGYAGTGKSYTTRQLSLQLAMNGWKISRVAPTGRAAQLISGRTIHSWLDPIIEELPGNKVQIIGFRKQVMKEKECLIIDEFSMVDNELWNKIKSIWAQSKHLNSKKIVIVGDPGQLEPIGDGKPFIKMITNKTYPITNLKKIYRNSRNSDILKLASYVRRNGYLNIKSDFQQIKLITSEQALQMARDHQSIQFITPRRTSSVGSLALNKRIKQIMNITSPPDFHTLLWNDKQHSFVNDASVHKGDKVVVVRNIWQWNITNGTIGIYLGKTKVKLFNHVREEYSRLQSVYKFRNPDTNKIFYLPINSDIRSKLELAYAITIHKAQGSEYKSIILYLPTTQIRSKMLYTAITRTTNMLYIYRSKKPYGT